MSIRYMLFHRPVVMADCLDRARREESAQVEVTLKTASTIGDTRILTQMLATFRWAFGRQSACVSQVCGSIERPSTHEERTRAVESANARLAEWLTACREAGASVSVRPERFELAPLDAEGRQPPTMSPDMVGKA